MPPNSESKPPKKKVLDLIEDQPKPSRRERQREQAAVKQPAAPVVPPLPVKKAALDIFEESGTKKKNTGVRKAAHTSPPLLETHVQRDLELCQKLISEVFDPEKDIAPAVFEKLQSFASRSLTPA